MAVGASSQPPANVALRAATLDLPQGAEKRRAVEEMFDRIAPRYDLLNGLITLGTHHRWKRKAIEALGITPASRVIDLACGTGDLLFELGRKGVRGVGVDISTGMLTSGAPARCARIPDARFGRRAPLPCRLVRRPGVRLRAPQLRRDRAGAPRGGACAATGSARRVRRGRPTRARALLAAFHRVWFERMVPLLGRLASDAAAYRYLPASASYLPDEAALRSLFEQAGFTDVRKRSFLLGAAQLVSARRSESPC